MQVKLHVNSIVTDLTFQWYDHQTPPWCPRARLPPQPALFPTLVKIFPATAGKKIDGQNTFVTLGKISNFANTNNSKNNLGFWKKYQAQGIYMFKEGRKEKNYNKMRKIPHKTLRRVLGCWKFQRPKVPSKVSCIFERRGGRCRPENFAYVNKLLTLKSLTMHKKNRIWKVEFDFDHYIHSPQVSFRRFWQQSGSRNSGVKFLTLISFNWKHCLPGWWREVRCWLPQLLQY